MHVFLVKNALFLEGNAKIAPKALTVRRGSVYLIRDATRFTLSLSFLLAAARKNLKKAPKMDVSLKETRVSLKEMHFSLKETRFTQGKIAKIAPKAPQEGGAPNSPYTQEKQVPPSGFFY